MRLFIHCGYPKTGTTALQKWLHQNSSFLANHDVSYSSFFRDEEGIGNHLLNSLVKNDAKNAACSISEACSSNSSGSTVFSAEGLSNLLGEGDPQAQCALKILLDSLLELSIDAKFLFALRPLDSYICSITVQNIVFDRLAGRPSDYAAFAIDALARSYYNLSELVETGRVELFDHSRSVNLEIVRRICCLSGDEAVIKSVHEVEHRSPGDGLVLFIMWLNSRNPALPAEFLSYLRFGVSSARIIDSCLRKVLDCFQNYESYLKDWEPSSNLVHSAMAYYSMAWEKHLSYPAAARLDGCASNQLSLRRRVIGDLSLFFSPRLAALDYLYDACTSPSAVAFLESALHELVDSGSAEWGRDFDCVIQMAS